MIYDAVMVKTHQIAIRLTNVEFERLEEVHRRAQRRTLGYITMADTIRELMGFIPLNAVSEEDRILLSTGSKKVKAS